MTDKNLIKNISSQEALAGYLTGDEEALNIATISSGLLADSVVRLLARDTAFLSVSAQATDAELGELWESLRHFTHGDLVTLAGVDPWMIPNNGVGAVEGTLRWCLLHEPSSTIPMTEIAMELATQAFGFPTGFSGWWRNADPSRYHMDREGEVRRDFRSAVWVARLTRPADELEAEAHADQFKLLLYAMKFPPDDKRAFLNNFVYGSPGWRAYARYAIETNSQKCQVHRDAVSFHDYQKRAERLAEELDPYESVGPAMTGDFELDELLDDHFGFR